MDSTLIDQIANAIGSADIGAPWTVDDYPKSVTTERYRKLARASVSLGVPSSPGPFVVGSVLIMNWGMSSSIEVEIIARTGDNFALNMNRDGSWKHAMSLDDLIKAKAVHIGWMIPRVPPRLTIWDMLFSRRD
ncbi:MAG TPA: hypothetical protein VL357_05970 [Rariglobus sp.]|jgi:hypothetical protein|nr:hypothetical protein [Rariglobus sp.]